MQTDFHGQRSTPAHLESVIRPKNTGAPPGTRTPNPLIKRPLIRTVCIVCRPESLASSLSSVASLSRDGRSSWTDPWTGNRHAQLPARCRPARGSGDGNRICAGWNGVIRCLVRGTARQERAHTRCAASASTTSTPSSSEPTSRGPYGAAATLITISYGMVVVSVGRVVPRLRAARLRRGHPAGTRCSGSWWRAGNRHPMALPVPAAEAPRGDPGSSP
jgi:hypothetical protein